LGVFSSSEVEPELVLAAMWCHRRILMSPIDSAISVYYRLSVDVLRLSCTVEKSFDIFGRALKFCCKLAFDRNFCEFDRCNDPVLNPPVVQGVKLPPGRSFRCCVVTVMSFGKRFGDFVGI
jgi:hypothetical protein